MKPLKLDPDEINRLHVRARIKARAIARKLVPRAYRAEIAAEAANLGVALLVPALKAGVVRNTDAYLEAIVHNAIVERLRRLPKEDLFGPEVDRIAAPVGVEDAYRRKDLFVCLAAYPAWFGQLLHKETTLEQVAAELGVSVTTVWRLKAQYLEELRAKIR